MKPEIKDIIRAKIYEAAEYGKNAKLRIEFTKTEEEELDDIVDELSEEINK